MTSTTDHILYSVDAGVATIALNRPEKRNAVSLDMWLSIAACIADARANSAVRVLVVASAGDHFCAGADISALGGPDAGRFRDANQAAEDALASFPKPTIAAIRGSCVGAGAQISTACDLRFGDTTARVGITPARLGIIYPISGLERAVRLLGPSAAKHLLLSAELIDADRAFRIGFLDELHEPDALTERVAKFTTLLATERSLLTQQASKAMVDAVAQTGSVPAELVSYWAAEAAACPEELDEGRAAFAERRTPSFGWTGPRTEPS